MIERDLDLVSQTGCSYHVCHVSTKEGAELIRQAKKSGLDVSGETAPHYLLLCDEDLIDDGRFKMNPPIRDASDREALIEAVLDGTLEVIATDHAPHTAQEKSRGLAGSLNGIVGLETAFPVLYTGLVRRGIMPLETLIDRMSASPSRRFGLGIELSAGSKANFNVFDLDSKYNVDPNEFLSMGRATPFEGMEVYGKCLMTAVEGEIVYRG
jgi:dihydroorotase